jgi:hypothetical protein
MQLPSMRPSFRRYCARREGEGRRGERAAGAVEDENKTRSDATRRMFFKTSRDQTDGTVARPATREDQDCYTDLSAPPGGY